MGVVLALSKGRAASYPLLRVIQRLSAELLASNIFLCNRRLPSEANQADPWSRLFEAKVSALRRQTAQGVIQRAFQHAAQRSDAHSPRVGSVGAAAEAEATRLSDGWSSPCSVCSKTPDGVDREADEFESQGSGDGVGSACSAARCSSHGDSSALGAGAFAWRRLADELTVRQLWKECEAQDGPENSGECPVEGCASQGEKGSEAEHEVYGAAEGNAWRAVYPRGTPDLTWNPRGLHAASSRLWGFRRSLATPTEEPHRVRQRLHRLGRLPVSGWRGPLRGGNAEGCSGELGGVPLADGSIEFAKVFSRFVELAEESPEEVAPANARGVSLGDGGLVGLSRQHRSRSLPGHVVPHLSGARSSSRSLRGQRGAAHSGHQRRRSPCACGESLRERDFNEVRLLRRDRRPGRRHLSTVG